MESNNKPTSELNTENEEMSTDIQPQKGRKLFFAVLLILLLGGCGFGLYYYFSLQNEAEDEKVAYEVLEGNNNPEDYRYFLKHFPESAHTAEVQTRLGNLENMLRTWNLIALSDNAIDFVNFKNKYEDPMYTHICEIKIDSLDFIAAQRSNTPEAFQHYLDNHPDGRYSSEASIALGNIREQEITPETHEQIVQIICEFFRGFETQDEATISSNIVATMRRFINQENATKADVIRIINQMFSEHITGCQFIVNRDIKVSKLNGIDNTPVYQATFTLDQHIQRDNEGKTFGSYRCDVELTPDLLINAISMQEISHESTK